MSDRPPDKSCTVAPWIGACRGGFACCHLHPTKSDEDAS